jgi:hypothetical protein
VQARTARSRVGRQVSRYSLVRLVSLSGAHACCVFFGVAGNGVVGAEILYSLGDDIVSHLTVVCTASYQDGALCPISAGPVVGHNVLPGALTARGGYSYHPLRPSAVISQSSIRLPRVGFTVVPAMEKPMLCLSAISLQYCMRL